MSKLKIYTFPTGQLCCNCSVIYSEETREALIIDPGDDIERIMKLVESKGLKVTKLLHTHAHFDHIGCSKNLKEKLDCEIHLHQGDQELYHHLAVQRQMFGFSADSPGSVDCWIEDEQDYLLMTLSLSFYRLFIRQVILKAAFCFYTEYFEKPILFAGDTLFQQSIGGTDLPGETRRKFKSQFSKGFTHCLMRRALLRGMALRTDDLGRETIESIC